MNRTYKREAILKALDDGEHRKLVAQRFGVTPSYISELIKKYRDGQQERYLNRKPWAGQTMAKLQQDHIDFVVAEAAKHKVSPSVFVRSMMVDAIFEAKQAQQSSATAPVPQPRGMV